MTGRTRPLRTPALLVAVALLVGMLGGVASALATYRADVRPLYTDDGILTILVLGSDIGWPMRPGEETRGRADGVHVIAVDPAALRATVVSIPRDSLVGGNKVNAFLATGGPESMVRQIEGFTGLEMDYWALTSFHGLERLVEGMGGIEVEVERPMTSIDALANLQPGFQRLSGADALAFTRDRKSMPRGDFDRTRNQGRLLAAAHTQIRSGHRDLLSLTTLTAEFLRQTHTNIPREEVLPLALLAAEIPPEQVRLVPLDGGFGTTSGGASIVHLNTQGVFDQIRAGQVGP